MAPVKKKKSNKKIYLAVIAVIALAVYCIFGGKDISKKSGMTWGSLGSSSISTGSVTAVSCYGTPAPDGAQHCDEKKGDTACTQSRPILCIKKNSAAPGDLTDISSTNKYASWGGGDISLSKAVSGMELRSKSHADDLCTEEFGHHWKMAEFHDGSEFGFRGKGGLPEGTRFWVANNAEDANCW